VIVVDTGPLVALVNGQDKHHGSCRDWFSTVRKEPLVIPAPVLGEAWYLIGKACGAAVEVRPRQVPAFRLLPG
jgi:predicted nucleic acid-binding protein